LSGFVDTPDQRIRAEDITWGVQGVRSVENNITLKPLD
jgi:osmotically-inducible protein OsmY